MSLPSTLTGRADPSFGADGADEPGRARGARLFAGRQDAAGYGRQDACHYSGFMARRGARLGAHG